MKFNKVGRSGLLTSDITLGTMTFGDDSSKGTSKQESLQIIHAYLDGGGNHLDTANAYTGGESEKIIGEALKDRRSNVILATKVNFPEGEGVNQKGLSRSNIIRTTEASLKRLQTDYIDLLYMHAQDVLTPIDESLRAFDDLVRSGKVRYIGVSNFQAWRLMKALAVSDSKLMERFIAAQYQYSLVKRDIEYEFVSLFEEEGLGLFPWGPLGGGFLTGKYQRDVQPDADTGRIGTHPDNTEEAWHRRNTERNWDILDVVQGIANDKALSPAAISIAWARHRPTVSSVIIGARTMKQLESNLKAATIDMSPEEMELLNKASQLPELYPYRFLDVYGRK